IGIRATVIENKVETLTITTLLFPSKKVLRTTGLLTERCLLPAALLPILRMLFPLTFQTISRLHRTMSQLH
ncbi:hypothetical protein Tco_0258266, partial [Tanacetum coccineum]